MATDAAQVATALLTEHLQYTPLSLIDDIINSVNNYIYQGVGSLETGLQSTPPDRLGFKSIQESDGELDFPEAKQEIEEGLHKLETLLNSTVDKNFDKFEIYVLRNILSIPTDLVNWVRLSHYEGISYPITGVSPSDEQIQVLRRKLAASRTVCRALTQEHNRNEAILAQLKALLGQTNASTGNLSFLTQTTAARSLNISTSSQSLTTNTTFTMSHLPALKDLLAELRPQLSRLKDKSNATNTAKDERNQERREYIDQRTRTHLEKSGETTMEDASGLPGQRLEADEIQALEKVAAVFQPT